MLRQVSSRSYRSKGGFKCRGVLEVVLIVGVALWLLYQVKDSFVNKNSHAGEDGGGEVNDGAEQRGANKAALAVDGKDGLDQDDADGKEKVREARERSFRADDAASAVDNDPPPAKEGAAAMATSDVGQEGEKVREKGSHGYDASSAVGNQSAAGDRGGRRRPNDTVVNAPPQVNMSRNSTAAAVTNQIQLFTNLTRGSPPAAIRNSSSAGGSPGDVEAVTNQIQLFTNLTGDAAAAAAEEQGAGDGAETDAEVGGRGELSAATGDGAETDADVLVRVELRSTVGSGQQRAAVAAAPAAGEEEEVMLE